MPVWVNPLANDEAPPSKGLRLGETSLGQQDLRQALETIGELRMVGTEHSLADFQSASR